MSLATLPTTSNPSNPVSLPPVSAQVFLSTNVLPPKPKRKFFAWKPDVNKIRESLKPKNWWITPDSRIRSFMDFIMCIVLVYNAITVPYRIGFEYYTPWGFYVLDFFMDILAFCNMLLQFLEVREVGSEVIKSRKLTIKTYLPKFILVECVAIAPSDYIAMFCGYTHPICRINRLWGLVAVERYSAVFERTLTIADPIYLRIFKALFYLAVVMHWFTCAWFLIGANYGTFMFTDPNFDPLIYSLLIPPDNYEASYTAFRLQQYLVGLLFNTQYLVGYSSMLPQNPLETLFGLLSVLIGSTFFAIIVGIVSKLLDGLDQTGAKFKEKLDTLKDYMRFRKIAPQLQSDVKEFYLTLFRSRRIASDEQMLADLEKSIQRELARFLHKDTVGKVPFISRWGQMFVDDICMVLRHTLLLKGYFIVRKGEIGKEMFFIGNGSVEVVTEEGTVLKVLTKGAFFGEIALLQDTKRMASIRASEQCELYVLRKSDFDAVLDKYPEAKKAMQEEAEKRMQDTAAKTKQAVSKVKTMAKISLATKAAADGTPSRKESLFNLKALTSARKKEEAKEKGEHKTPRKEEEGSSTSRSEKPEPESARESTKESARESARSTEDKERPKEENKEKPEKQESTEEPAKPEESKESKEEKKPEPKEEPPNESAQVKEEKPAEAATKKEQEDK